MGQRIQRCEIQRSNLAPIQNGAMLSVFIALVICVIPASGQIAGTDAFSAARNEMVTTRIEIAGVKNPRVLRVMRETPRHEFVPRSQVQKAYLDMALPIGGAQTISSPFIVAWMTETIDPQPTDRVLEIGTGSGYQAAVLSPLVESVYTIEIVPELGKTAQATLARLGYQNVHVQVGDGFLGWPEAAPFDKIIVTCSPEDVPKPLIEQLREGGKILIPVGERFQQTLYLMTKVDGKLVGQPLQPTLFVPMTGKAEAARRVQPDPANPSVINGSFERPSTETGPEAEALAGTIPGWYYERQATEIRGDAFEGDRFVRFTNATPDLASHLLQGIPLDGRAVTSLRISGAVRTDAVQGTGQPDSLPAIVINLYDAQRRDLGVFIIGPFKGTRDWRHHSRLVRVPPQSREAIIRIGLFGAVGTADFDSIKVETLR
ncbi:MAG TPA: protein-L-isoaspartate(D-aspartate) O-methyltransferase [Planctomycetaceae bacterium]|nr:protein-L-isoaspartate(D-aspartate) O-methyltransferase [Planctomycetaceae bacterium]